MTNRPIASRSVSIEKKAGPGTIRDHHKRLAELARGLSHPLRVEIIRMLANQPTDRPCICADIVNALPLAQSTVSQHLKVLKETGWITGEADGTSVHYCLEDGILELYQDLLRRIIIHNKKMGLSGDPCLKKLLGEPRHRKGANNVRSD